MAYGVRGRSSDVFGPSVYRGPASRRALAFTFDDGPSESTPGVVGRALTVTASGHLSSSAALTSNGCPRVAREVARRGHEIGNHSHTHPRFYFRKPAFIRDESARAQDSHRGTLPAFLRRCSARRSACAGRACATRSGGSTCWA